MSDHDVSAESRGIFYPILFSIGILVTLLFLIGNMIAATLDDIWLEESRVYDTKWEHFISVFVGSKRTNLIKAGHDPKSWYIRFLSDVDEWAYLSATKKIPENDFERVSWFYGSIFLPIAHESQQSRIDNIELLMPPVYQTLQHVEKYQMSSGIIKDIDMHFVIKDYAGYFFAYGKRYYSPEDFETKKQDALNAVFFSTNSLNISRVFSYNKGVVTRVIFSSLKASHKLLSEHIFENGICNQSIAEKWMMVSHKIKAELINNTSNVKLLEAHMQGKPMFEKYLEFQRQFENEYPKIVKKIGTDCPKFNVEGTLDE